MTIPIWIATADARGGRLCRVTRTPTGRVHAEPIDEHATDYDELAHQHVRPSPRKGRDGQSPASEGHESETMLRHAAKSIVAWADRSAARHAVDRLHLFLPPRLSGEVQRCAWPDAFRDRVVIHEGDLAPLPPGELAAHPAVELLMPVPARA